MSDADRYVDLRSSWSSADEQFNWLVDEVSTHNNGEPVDDYCLHMAARDIFCSSLVEIAGWDEDKAVDFVSQGGALTAEIADDDELGQHLLLAWQPEGESHAEVFVYAINVEEEL